jgi:tetratricopeptide (TPR) repeat protein
MKKLFVFIVLIFAGTYAIAQSTKEERNKQTVTAAFSAMQTGDMEDAFKNYEKNILFSGNGGVAARSLELDSLKMNTATNRANWARAFPDVKQQIISVSADGDYVMLYTKSSGTWKKNFTIWQASGKPYQISDVTVYKFNNDGKIIEQQRILPLTSVMDQVGEGGEFEMNKAGYRLLEQKKYKEAIEVFKLNAKLYPNSSNVFDSLGEAYMLAGDKKKAIGSYEKSIKLDPENTNGKDMLAKLKQ